MKEINACSGVVRFMVIALAALWPAVAAAQGGPQGFGADTPGGAGGSVVRVTHLGDSGPGSLRDALSRGNRTVVFDVAGEIALRSFLYVLGDHVTIDGLSAPAPGITLTGYGLIIRGDKGAHDVIVRGLRVRNAAVDGIQVAAGASNVLIERVSVSGSVDGSIDITEGAHDVTVAWSILGANGKNMLVKYRSSRVTLHHNAFLASATRSPQIRMDDTLSAVADEITADIRNNLVANWDTGYGTIVWYGPWANVVNNYYASAGDALTVKKARAYIAGNFTRGRELKIKGSERAPFAAPAVATQDACAAAVAVLASAGARPLDATDEHLLSVVEPPACGKATPLPPVLSAGLPNLAFQAVASGPNPTSQTVSLAELHAQTVSWTASVSSPWLTVSPTSGTTPSSLRVSARATGLPAGTHGGTVTLRPQGGAPLTVPVVLVVVPKPTDAVTVEMAVEVGADDAREDAAGVVRTREKLLPVGGGNLVALRFAGVPIPQGAVIGSAVIGLVAVNRSTLGAPLSVRYLGEAAGTSAPLTEARHNLSARATTRASVLDTAAEWELDHANPSSDLTAVIQEIVARTDWAPGNALTVFLDDAGTGDKRMVGSRDDRVTRAATLTVQYWSP